jgi:formate hydrogenlyase subunit 4
MINASDLLITVVSTVIIAIFGIVAGLYLMGIDRKLTAHMQARVGPPIHQPFTDVRKLLIKESIVPENAIPWLFNAAPVVALASTVLILLYIPIGNTMPVLGAYGDLVLVMYLLTIPALALVAGGFASGSPYATVGAQREMVTMMAYEFPLAIVVIGIAWRLSAAGLAEPFSLGTIAENPIWGLVGPIGIIGCLLLFFVLIVVMPGELSRIPADTPEAETELAGGLLVEYSGRNLAMFYITQGAKTLVMAAVVVAIFLPWNISSFIAMPAAAAFVADLVFFFVKVVLVMFFAISLLRVGMARFRITQVFSLYWLYLGVIGLIGLFLLMSDALLVSGGGGLV